MGRVAEVFAVVREMIRGVPVTSVSLQHGGDETSSADHYGPSGDDSPPLPGDYAQTTTGQGSGNELVVGYHDTRNAGQALPGERRLYARSENGDVVGTIWLKRDGVIRIETTAPVEIVGAEVRLGDGASYIATAGDLVAVSVPLMIAGPTPVTTVIPTLTGPTGYAAVGQILPRQTRSKA